MLVYKSHKKWQKKQVKILIISEVIEKKLEEGYENIPQFE